VVDALARNWWALTVRGVAALIFGILAFAWPGSAIFAIVILFGAYALVDGIFALVAAVRAAQAHQRWWALVLEGIVGIAIAGITYFEPHVTAFALYFTIAAWAFITGVLEIAAGIQLRKHVSGELWLIAGGVLSILFSILMIYKPLTGAIAIVWVIGAYAIMFGISMIALSLRLRGHAKA